MKYTTTGLILIMAVFFTACGKKHNEENNDTASARLTIQGLR